MSEKQFIALLVRAFKTFVQAFLAVLLAGLTEVSDLSTLRALAVAAVAAGLSAIMNFIVKPEEAK